MTNEQMSTHTESTARSVSKSDWPDETQRDTECPECTGQLIRDSDTDETVCAECGLVVDEQRIDQGPEWRTFDADHGESASRVGSPLTHRMHDKGLTTDIGWQNRDAHGNPLSARQRQKMSRLRTWDERFRTQNSKDRNLKRALGEIDRMASALGVPDPTRETASVIYRRALDEDLLPGRSIESVATCALYAATRTNGISRTIDELTEVSRVEKLDIERTYRYISRELDLQIPPSHPMEYVGRFASELDCTSETDRCARKLIDDATEQGVHSGKNPAGIAAAALYAASRLCGETIIQPEISEVANISEVTIRQRYRDVLDATDLLEADEI